MKFPYGQIHLLAMQHTSQADGQRSVAATSVNAPLLLLALRTRLPSDAAHLPPENLQRRGALTYSRCISSAACSETLKMIDLKHGAKHGYELGVDRKC